MKTEPGIASCEMEGETVTLAPAAGAGPDKLTVQVVVPGVVNVDGVHVTERNDTTLAGTSVREPVVEVAFADTVTVAFVLEATAVAVAVKLAEELPSGITNDAGTVTCETEEKTATAVPPAGAAADRLTLHVAVPGAVRVAGVHTTDDTEIGGAGISITELAADDPFQDACTEPRSSEFTAEAAAVKLAEDTPAGIETVPGTASCETDGKTDMVAPPSGAGPDSVIAHVVFPGVVIVEGEHAMDVRATAGIAAERVTEADPAVPFQVALTNAFVVDVTADATAVKLADEPPAGIDTEEATASCELDEDSATVAPPAGATADSVTLHVAEPGVVMVAGVQDRDEMDTLGAGVSITKFATDEPL